jgi:valyl-tRNA synthetase
VLDTWFSSWLWPISVFDGFKDPQNKDINYFYPTNDLVTAPEILFFWVARMIMAGYMFRGEIPFKKVYLTGIVRDKQGRKMSKSLGNSPDPLDLIEEYGADGIRVGMLLSSPAGNDLLFDEKLCLQGRNFTNKIYNAYNLISGWEIKEGNNEDNMAAIEWMESKFSAALIELEDNFSKYRLSDALMNVYKLVWDDFCSNYLEMIKPGFKQPIDRETYTKTINLFEKLLKVIHPFTPFISEEYWHKIKERSQNECIIVAIEHGDLAIEIVSNIRNIRNAKQIAKFDPLKLYVKNVPAELISKFSPVIKKLACIESIETTQQPIDGASTFIIRSNEFYIPVGGSIDVEKEKENLLKQLEHKRGFLASVEKKLSNEKFVTGAPAPVLELERKKKADAEAEIQALEKSLANL